VRLRFVRVRFVRLRFVRLRFVRLRFVRLRFVRLRFVRVRFVRLASCSFFSFFCKKKEKRNVLQRATRDRAHCSSDAHCK
jgi:hypothetical protein